MANFTKSMALYRPADDHGTEAFLRLYLEGKFVKSYLLKAGETKVGRDPACGVCIEDKFASRRHFTLEYEGDHRLYIQDLNSRNGTFVNGQRVQRTSLAHGDKIAFGSYELVVSLPGSAQKSNVIPFPNSVTEIKPEPQEPAPPPVFKDHSLESELKLTLPKEYAPIEEELPAPLPVFKPAPAPILPKEKPKPAPIRRPAEREIGDTFKQTRNGILGFVGMVAIAGTAAWYLYRKTMSPVVQPTEVEESVVAEPTIAQPPVIREVQPVKPTKEQLRQEKLAKERELAEARERVKRERAAELARIKENERELERQRQIALTQAKEEALARERERKEQERQKQIALNRAREEELARERERREQERQRQIAIAKAKEEQLARERELKEQERQRQIAIARAKEEERARLREQERQKQIAIAKAREEELARERERKEKEIQRKKAERNNMMAGLDKSLGGLADANVNSLGGDLKQQNLGDSSLQGKTKKMAKVSVEPFSVEITMPDIPKTVMGSIGDSPSSAPKNYDSKAFKQMLRSRIGVVENCYTQHAGDSGQAGSLSIWLTIRKNGTVQNTGIDHSSFKNQPLHDCVLREVRDLNLDAPPWEGFTVNYTFKFGGSSKVDFSLLQEQKPNKTEQKSVGQESIEGFKV